MQTGRAAGEDGFLAEVLKYGGKKLRGAVFGIVRTMWSRAIDAPGGSEGADWPEEWNIGIVVPLWKPKCWREDTHMARDYPVERRVEIVGQGRGV